MPQVLLYDQELTRLKIEALSAMEARNIAKIVFFDFSGASVGQIFGVMDCELIYKSRAVQKLLKVEPTTRVSATNILG